MIIAKLTISFSKDKMIHVKNFPFAIIVNYHIGYFSLSIVMTKGSKLLIVGKCNNRYSLFFYNIISKPIESRMSQHSDFLDIYIKNSIAFSSKKKKCCYVMDKQKTSMAGSKHQYYYKIENIY